MTLLSEPPRTKPTFIIVINNSDHLKTTDHFNS